jgi:hypothetical protein
MTRPDDLVDRRETERHEQQTGLIDVAIVAVDDMDVHVVLVELPPQAIGDHGAAGTAAENHDLLPHDRLLFASSLVAESLDLEDAAGVRNNYATVRL